MTMWSWLCQSKWCTFPAIGLPVLTLVLPSTSLFSILQIVTHTVMVLMDHPVAGEPLCPTRCTCPTMDVIECGYQNLSKLPMLTNRNTRRVNLSHNFITVLHNVSFATLNYLHAIHLDHNKLESIESGTFSHLQSLQYLNLSWNRLHRLDRYLFHNLVNLRVLNLSHNFLDAISPHIFVELHQLTVLDLSGNRLVDIPNRTFGALFNLQRLSLAQNPLDLELQMLFQQKNSLLHLNLSSVGLSHLPRNLLQPLGALWSLDMSFNNLTEIRTISFQHLSNLTHLNISHNPLHCNCGIKPLQEWLATREGLEWGQAEDTPRCDKPPQYSGIKLLAIPAANLSCPSHHGDTMKGVESHSFQTVLQEELPYNSMMGWYTAATLSGMLVLFLLCIVLDKAKRAFHRFRKERRAMRTKYNYSAGTPSYKGQQLGGASEEVDGVPVQVQTFDGVETLGVSDPPNSGTLLGRSLTPNVSTPTNRVSDLPNSATLLGSSLASNVSTPSNAVAQPECIQVCIHNSTSGSIFRANSLVLPDDNEADNELSDAEGGESVSRNSRKTFSDHRNKHKHSPTKRTNGTSSIKRPYVRRKVKREQKYEISQESVL